MRKGLKAIIDKVGVTSILVTHDQEEAFDLADQIVIFNRCVPTQRIYGKHEAVSALLVPCPAAL